MHTTLQSLFAYKSWADAELLAAVANLPAQHAEQLPACIRTLNHIHIVDCIFRAHLSDTPRPYDATHTKELPTLEALQTAMTETDSWYEQYVANVSEAALNETLAFTFTDGDAGKMSRLEILMHVITHGSNHRGNVGQILKSLAINPPRDLYTKFLHLREPERRAGHGG